jgi:membrane-bound ClpP family serine protease
LWPEPGVKSTGPNIHTADAAYAALQHLAPKDDKQRALKAEALGAVVQLAELRTVLRAQALSSVSKPLLIIVVGWLAVIFLSFSLLAPSTHTVTVALIVAALSVTAAIFLMMELDHPFDGLIRIPPDPLLSIQPDK